MAWLVNENAPVMTAWLAITVAAVARITIGARATTGIIWKNQSMSGTGWPCAARMVSSAKAPWPR